MDINKLLHIFTQLTHSLISGSVREPILEMAAEIEVEVAVLTGNLSRAYSKIDGLLDKNEVQSARINQLDIENARLTANQYYGKANTATKLLKQLILNDLVSYNDPFIKEAVQEYFKHNNKIMAIKEYRALTGKGLAEAKRQVEEWIDDLEE